MFDKLEDMLVRYEEIMNELNEPDVTNNQARFRKLMKDQSDLTPLQKLIQNTRNVKKPYLTAWKCQKWNLMKK